VDSARDVVLLSIRRDTAEIEELIRSLGYRLVLRVVQARTRADPYTFIGKGKLEDVRKELDALATPHPPVAGGRPLVVVDAPLKPPQLFGIEDVVKAEVWDRLRVILEIFQQKAQVKEARLQVELARLRYELPFVHEALHRTLTGEHPGFMGGGELPMRTYETHLKRRTKKIQDELNNVKRERAQRRAGRRKSGFQLVAIAGYTNSGKSSLLNALAGSEAHVENVYFSTLQTTTRKLRPELFEGRVPSLLFTDTVGFIRDLPPWLIDAFSSTLEEVVASDVILLVVDSSEPIDLIRSKLTTAWELLDRLHASKRRIIVVNKVDLLPPSFLPDILNTLSLQTFFPLTKIVKISTKTGEGLRELVKVLVDQTIPARYVRVQLDPAVPGHLSFESWLRDHTEIVEEDHGGRRREFYVRCSPEEYVQLRRHGKHVDATLEELASTGS
jgi:GTPase